MAQHLGATDVIDPGAERRRGDGRSSSPAGSASTTRSKRPASPRCRASPSTPLAAGGSTVFVGAPSFEESLTIPNVLLWGMQEKKLLGCFMGSTNSLPRHPRVPGTVAGRAARPRVAHHRPPSARRDQRGLRRSRRRRGRSHRHRPVGGPVINPDELILVSVDDHICEPREMFDAPRAREVPRPGAARRRGGRRCRAVVVRRLPRPQHRPQRRSRQAARVLQPRRVALRRDAPGLLRRARACARHERRAASSPG